MLVETLPTLPAEVQSQINAQNKDKSTQNGPNSAAATRSSTASSC
jgi:hypothetical protein